MTLAGLVLAAMGGGAGLGLGRIAVIAVEGVITEDKEFLEDLRELRADRSVRGWVVYIDSPGGSVAPSQSIYQALRELRDEEDAPVVAAIGSVGASGGYYVALGADSILALPGSITGSIGVIMEYPNVSELMAKVGVSMEVVKAGEQKDIGSPFRSMGPEDRAIVNALITDVHEQFIEVVAAERRMPLDEARRLADGRIVSGRQAQALGLVDRLGNVQDAIELAGRLAGLDTDEPGTVRPRRDEGWLGEALFGRATVAAVRGLANPLAGGWPVLRYIVH